MYRWDIIQKLIKDNNYESYCEIGVFHSWNWDKINCKYKVAVDPSKGIPTPQGGEFYNCTSDDFFKNNNKKFDIFFIDGLHEAEQVYRDIENSLKFLNKNGTIVAHDANPPKYEHTTTGIDGFWTGDTYKGIIKARQILGIEIETIDTDWGVSIIKDGNDKIELPDINWEYFDKNRVKLLNLRCV